MQWASLTTKAINLLWKDSTIIVFRIPCLWNRFSGIWNTSWCWPSFTRCKARVSCWISPINFGLIQYHAEFLQEILDRYLAGGTLPSDRPLVRLMGSQSQQLTLVPCTLWGDQRQMAIACRSVGRDTNTSKPVTYFLIAKSCPSMVPCYFSDCLFWRYSYQCYCHSHTRKLSRTLRWQSKDSIHFITSPWFCGALKQFCWVMCQTLSCFAMIHHKMEAGMGPATSD